MQIKTPASFSMATRNNQTSERTGKKCAPGYNRTIPRSNDNKTPKSFFFCRVDQKTLFRQIQMSKLSMTWRSEDFLIFALIR